MANVRRPRGTGSIVKEDGRFRASITLKDETGEKVEYRTRVATYREGEEFLNNLLREHHLSGRIPARRSAPITFREYAAEFLVRRERSGELAHNTLEAYEGAVRMWLNPVIGSIAIKEVGVRDLERVRDYLRDTPNSRGKQNSHASMLVQWRVLRTILRDAAHRGVRGQVPDMTKRGTYPRTRGVENVASDDVTLRVIPQTAHSRIMRTLGSERWQCTAENHLANRCAALWVTLFSTGMRIGELAAIPVSNYEDAHPDGPWVEGSLTLNWHLERVPTRHGCGERNDDGSWECGEEAPQSCPDKIPGRTYRERGLKSDNTGERTIELPGLETRILSRHLKVLRESGASEPDDYFFQNPSGEPIAWEAARRIWRRLWREAHKGIANAPAPYRLHDIRHTFAYRTLHATVDGEAVPVLAVARTMGHSSIETTQRYTRGSTERTSARVTGAASSRYARHFDMDDD